MSLLLESTIETSVILIAALALMPLLRQRPAALRHWILLAALVCSASAPLVGLIVPPWHLPAGIAPPPVSGARLSGTSHAVAVNAPAAATDRQPGTGAPAATGTPVPLGTAWVAGAAVGIALLVIGLLRLGRLTARARPISEGAWAEVAEEIGREYGLTRRVALLQSAHPTLLMTWGLARPRILVPAAAQHWSIDRVRVVLAHELAHVRRADWIVQLAAEVFRAVHWFNPLVWIACTRLRYEAELACDDAVLNAGVEASGYATHLLDIARHLQRQRRLRIPAPAIVRRSHLERRVRAMLDPRLNRRPLSRFAAAAILLAVMAVSIPIAGFAAQTFAALTGSIADPTNGFLPGVTLVLTNTQTKAKYEIQSDRNGRYQFVGLVPGEYLLETSLPGFKRFQGKLTVIGSNVQQDLTLQVGSLEETVTVRDGSVAPPSSPEAQRLLEERLRKRQAQVCTAAPATGSPRMGGNLRPPVKIRDVRPLFPSHLSGTGNEGTVVLQSRIGTDGSIAEVTVVSTTNPDFAAAAVDAVRQWQFDETLLNCVPVPVDMKVTVNFKRTSN